MKKCRQKDGGFWPLLTGWFLSLQVFTTDQPRSRAFKKTFAPLFFAKNFHGLVVFERKKIKDKIAFFRSWTQGFVKIMWKCFF